MTFRETLEELGGFWQYNGGRYLAHLASGKVSDIFCNTGVMTTNPRKLEPWTGALAEHIFKDIGEDHPAISVVGPGMGGITLAYQLAHTLDNDGFAPYSRAFFTEPHDVGGDKQQKLRFDLPDQKVLLIEDVITTGGSVQKTLSAIYKSGIKLMPMIACLVDRRNNAGDPLRLDLKSNTPSDHAVTLGVQVWEVPVISLLQIKPRTWDTVEQASQELGHNVEAIRPKQNWDKLTKS